MYCIRRSWKIYCSQSASPSGEKRLPSSIDSMKIWSAPVKSLWRLQQRSDCSNKFLFESGWDSHPMKVVKVSPIQKRPWLQSVCTFTRIIAVYLFCTAKLARNKQKLFVLRQGRTGVILFLGFFATPEFKYHSLCTPPHIIMAWTVEISASWVALAAGAWEF